MGQYIAAVEGQVSDLEIKLLGRITKLRIISTRNCAA
jgi:hypothetical protein